MEKMNWAQHIKIYFAQTFKKVLNGQNYDPKKNSTCHQGVPELNTVVQKVLKIMSFTLQSIFLLPKPSLSKKNVKFKYQSCQSVVSRGLKFIFQLVQGIVKRALFGAIVYQVDQIDYCFQAIWAEPHQIQLSISNSLIGD